MKGVARLVELRRATLAFLVVATITMAVQAALAQPETTPPQPLRLGDHAEYAVDTIRLDTGETGTAVTDRLTVDMGAPATIADSTGRPTLSQPLTFAYRHTVLGGQAHLQWTYWLHDAAVVAVQKSGTTNIAQTNLGSTETTQALAWDRLDWNPHTIPCEFSLSCKTSGQGPWPNDITWIDSNLLGSPGPGPVAHRLHLISAGLALVPPAQASVVAALPPIPDAPRHDGPSGSVPVAFALTDAVQLLRTATDPAIQQYHRDHPAAYLAYASSYTANDLAGRVQHAWHLILADQTDRLERIILQEPSMTPLLPPATSVVTRSGVTYALDTTPTVIPPESIAPDQMPDLLALQLAFAAVTGLQPTGYGFSIHCTSRLCNTVETAIHLKSERLQAAQPAPQAWQRNLDQVSRMSIQDGQIVQVERLDFGAARSTAIPGVLFEPRAEPERSNVAFDAPSAPEAVQAGLLALLAAAVVAAWPTLKLYIPLFTRIANERLLDHPVRRRIHDLINEEPGIHARQIGLRLDIAGNTATHHLNRLVTAGYLGQRRIGAYRCYFPRTGLDDRVQDAIPALKSSGSKAILNAIHQQGNPSFTALMQATGLSYATSHHHATRLWKAGLISSERDGKQRRFRLTELGRRLAHEATLEEFPTHPKNHSEVKDS